MKTKPVRKKFNNVYTTVDGIKFHSKLEAQFYKIIKKFASSNKNILDVKLQVPFVIAKDRKRKYIADFAVFTKNNIYVIECKGYQTEVSKLKMKLFEILYPGLELFIGSDIDKLMVFLKKIK